MIYLIDVVKAQREFYRALRQLETVLGRKLDPAADYDELDLEDLENGDADWTPGTP